MHRQKDYEKLKIKRKLDPEKYKKSNRECYRRRVEKLNNPDLVKPKIKSDRNDKGYSRNAYLKSKFGITLEEYKKMFEDQQGCCKICGLHQSKMRRALCIDHDHLSGKVRGLLCDLCNRGLGYARDSKDILLSMIKYLEERG